MEKLCQGINWNTSFPFYRSTNDKIMYRLYSHHCSIERVINAPYSSHTIGWPRFSCLLCLSFVRVQEMLSGYRNPSNRYRNYTAELSAFSHRLGAPEADKDALVAALTDYSYTERADVEGGVDEPLPSGNEGKANEDNTKMIAKGVDLLLRALGGQLRYIFPRAPEEFLVHLRLDFFGDSILAEVAAHLGVDSLVRTAEVPPSEGTCAQCVKALCAAIGETKTRQLSADLLLPFLYDVDFADVYPLKNPLAVLEQIHKSEGAKEIEPRLVRSAGVVSAQPLYVVSIYRDKNEVIGESAGETIEIATDMAAREGLLRCWGLTTERVVLVGNDVTKAGEQLYTKKNYSLAEKCAPGTDLSLDFDFDVNEEPLNLIETALQYKNEVHAVVGKSYTKRLRHKFSRGSLAKRSFRYLVKPKVYTVS